MQRYAAILAAVAAMTLPGAALAQSGTVPGAAGGAATGAIVGGPVGAVVGGVAGAAIGTILDPPPPEVGAVVIEQEVEPVVIEERVVVGEPLPETVVLRPVPGYETYHYAVVNEQRVIVDPRNRAVVTIVQ